MDIEVFEPWIEKLDQSAALACLSKAVAAEIVNSRIGSEGDHNYTIMLDLPFLRAGIVAACSSYFGVETFVEVATKTRETIPSWFRTSELTNAGLIQAALSCAYATLENKYKIGLIEYLETDSGYWIEYSGMLELHTTNDIWSLSLPSVIETDARELHRRWPYVRAMEFWADWCTRVIKGESPDWELWKRIALIDDKHWQTGPEAVAQEIDKLTMASRLRDAIEELEKQLVTISLQPVYQPNLHNGAPLLDDAVAGLTQIQFIKEKLTILKAELAKFDDPEVEPDPAVFAEIGEKLWGVAKDCGKFFFGVVSGAAANALAEPLANLARILMDLAKALAQ